MTVAYLEQRWKSISTSGKGPYHSLRISGDCISDLYISVDMKGARFMMLQIPDGVHVQCKNVEMENLTLEWYSEKRFILIGLRNSRFEDLYNDLVISLYNRIKDLANPLMYTEEFIAGFYKWAEFFDDTFFYNLSEGELKGIFGELVVLRHYLTTKDDLNETLKAWRGPYDGSHDFVFPDMDIEVKTKEKSHVAILISSEFQLQPEAGKEMQMVVVDVARSEEGANLNSIISEIKDILIKRGADTFLFLKTLARVRTSANNVARYNDFKWRPFSISFYNCGSKDFPKIISSEIQSSISNVKYHLAVSMLQNFLIQTIGL